MRGAVFFLGLHRQVLRTRTRTRRRRRLDFSRAECWSAGVMESCDPPFSKSTTDPIQRKTEVQNY